MDYSYITDTPSQPFSLYDFHGLPTPDPSQAPHGADDLIAAALVRSRCYPCAKREA